MSRSARTTMSLVVLALASACSSTGSGSDAQPTASSASATPRVASQGDPAAAARSYYASVEKTCKASKAALAAKTAAAPTTAEQLLAFVETVATGQLAAVQAVAALSGPATDRAAVRRGFVDPAEKEARAALADVRAVRAGGAQSKAAAARLTGPSPVSPYNAFVTAKGMPSCIGNE